MPYDNWYLTQAYPLDALQSFSAVTIISRINALDDAPRYFSVCPNCISPVCYIVSQPFKLVVCSASVRDAEAHTVERLSAAFGSVLVIHFCLPLRPKNLPHNPTITHKHSKKHQRRPNNLQRGNLWDHHEVNVPEVMEE